MNLADYVKNDPGRPGTKCRICTLDAKLLKQVTEGVAQGIPKTVIGRWLHTEHQLGTSGSSMGQTIGRHLKDCRGT